MIAKLWRKFAGKHAGRASSQRGFTLVETFVAISVLMIAIAGPLSIAQHGLSAAIYSRDQVTAYYLAQDAIEWIHNYRDDQTLAGNTADWSYATSGGNGQGWLSGVPAACFAGTCKIDTVGGTGLSSCSGSSCTLLFDSTTHLYQYSTGAASIFGRTVQFTSDSAQELTITVTISWRSSAFSSLKTLVVTEHIFNWQ